jgi:acyl transferase domain-containing protein/SAM-dependent methyltransferase
MKDFLQRIEKLSPKHLTLLACEQQARIEALERSRTEPVAIIGVGCRLPGDVDGPDSLWSLLAAGRDVISEIPPERMDVASLYDPDPAAAGRISTRWGGFLRDADQFDARFFGVSRREATTMDPQQRLLLETAWEALERGGVNPRGLSGERLGIFFGLSTADYYHLVTSRGADSIDGYTATGSAHSVAAGRLAYFLGTHGPAVAVDTACSSSLVATHLACQSLRSGDCDLAVAGGANLIAWPETMIGLSKARMLAPGGRCRTFDASAEGFVRAEGCGVIALKRLSAALRDGDPILAVIRGSALNQDGQSSGLTAPNGAAQESVIRQALENAGVKASDLQYVETHGTGTTLGDPIEAHALVNALGRGRDPRHPLYIGSVKTNLGHLEAAAGVTGLIKTALSIQHATIPAHLHFSRLNPHIDLDGAPIEVPVRTTDWPASGRRMAGVSSFGFSGTNAHIILEEAPARARAAAPAGREYTLVLSARTSAALRALAGRYAAHLKENPGVELRDVCHTANVGRARFEHATAIAARSVAEMEARLAAIASGAEEPAPAPAAAPEIDRDALKLVLPTYPFERQRYWVSASAPAPAPEAAGAAEPGFYHVVWEPKAPGEQSDSGRETQPLAPLAAAITAEVGPLSLQHGLDRYRTLHPLLDAQSFHYIVGALESLGWKPAPGEVFQGDELAARLGVRERYWRSFGRLLEILGEEGVLERAGDGWRVRKAPHAPAVANAASLCSEYPGFRGEIVFLERCGKAVGDVLRGQVDPLNLLFPDGSFETAEDLYQNSAGAHVFQALVQKTVLRLVEQSDKKKVRILEVGAGTGGTASYVAAALPGDRCEYVFTDISPLFVARAAEKFRQYPFLRFEVLDVERDPEAQGFAPQHYDIVIAANSLHATTDLRASVRNVRRLLAPGGALVLLEGAKPERWVDISFGFTEGWWKFTDRDLRPGYPLISGESWKKTLAETGFEDTHTAPPDPDSPQLIVVARRPAHDAGIDGAWLIVSGREGALAAEVTAQLEAAGERAQVIAVDADLPAAGDFRGVVDLRAVEIPPAAEIGRDGDSAAIPSCRRLLELTRRTCGVGGGRPVRLWVVTSGAQSVRDAAECASPAAASLWGFGRTVSLEQPDRWGGLIDLDSADELPRQAAAVVRELLQPDGEDQVACRGGERYAARLQPYAPPAPKPESFSPDACYLITGGLGGLGLVLAQWMARRSARRLILAGRSGVVRDEQRAALAEIESLGASVRVVQVDIADPDSVAGMFAGIAAEGLPLKGVFHVATVVNRDPVQEMTPESLAAVMRPKVEGAWLLHRHTREMALDFFCLFSSTASILGSGGLGHYAAANQFLDGFAAYRRSLGLPAVSIEWGTWDQMRTASEDNRRRYRSLGFLPMPSASALTALGQLLAGGEAAVMVAAVDWRKLKSSFEVRRKRPLLAGVDAAPAAARTDGRAAELAPGWSGMTAAERESAMASVVWEETRRVLAIEEGEPLELDRGFFEMGMDSLGSVELKTRLESKLGRSLPSMLTFNFPSVRALAARLSAEVAPPGEPAPAPQPVAVAPDPNTLDDDEVARLLAEKLSRIRTATGGVTTR